MSVQHGDGAPKEPRNQILIPVEAAVRQALAEYLRCARFTVHEGTPDVCDLSRAREFQLEQVLSDFPGPEVKLAYPSASIAEVAASTHTGGFTPSPIEDSWDPFTGSVLWSLGRAEGTLQVDFWADSIALRQALAAELPALFSPNEGMSGIYLQLPPTYACATARYTLVGQQTMDPPEAVWHGERRLQASVRYEAPLLSRRRGGRPLRLTIRVEDL